MEGSNQRRPKTQDRSIDPPRLVNHLQLRCTWSRLLVDVDAVIRSTNQSPSLADTSYYLAAADFPANQISFRFSFHRTFSKVQARIFLRSKRPYLIRVMLSARGSGRGRGWQSLIRGSRRRRTNSALWRVRSLCAPRTRVLLLQRPGHVEGHVALVPRRRSFSTRRPVLLSTTRLVLVVRMLALVDHAETIGFLDKRFLVAVGQQPAIKRPETKRSDEIGAILRRFVSSTVVDQGSHARTRFFAYMRRRRGWNESISITIRDTLEESKWEVWLVFLAA